jgi:FKBP-type peptidyl-prolyl cis-trans isomerase
MTRPSNIRKSIVVLAAVAAGTVAGSLTLHARQDTPAANATAPAATQPASTQPTAQQLENYKKLSYAIGLQIGGSLAEVPFDVDVNLLQQGIADGRAGASPKFTPQELAAAQQAVQAEMMAKMQAEQAKAAEEAKRQAAPNKEKGAAYAAENAKKPGVRQLPGGIQIETLKPGSGDKPKVTDTVQVHYTGMLIDGTKFDSSVDRGQPAEFPLDGVIPGWTEGLQQMQVGEKARLVIPSDKAYGDEGRPPRIPPGSTLVFEVELIKIFTPPADGAVPGQPGR